MEQPEWLGKLIPALETSGIIAEPRPVPGSPFLVTIEGTALAAGIHLDLTIDLFRDHPVLLPRIRISNAGEFKHLPHVDHDGTICYHERVGLSSSLRRPAEVVLDALERAIQTIEQGLGERNRGDFLAEAEWYWFRLGAEETVRSFLRPPREVKMLRVGYLSEKLLYVAGSPEDLKLWSPALLHFLHPHDRGLFIPLEDTILHEEPDIRSLIELPALRAFVHRHASSENRKILKARLARHPTMRLLVLGVPRTSHDQALLGIDLGRVSGPHPLSRRANPTGTGRPFSIQRFDREYLVERGGASMSLASRKVAVVGCGAIGGYVASALSRSGVGELLLIDPEKLERANLFRHVLGRLHLDNPKVIGLAAVLGTEIPYLEVVPDPRRIQDALQHNPTLLDHYDAIVNAMGDVTTTRWLNRELHPRISARVVHTWLEPLGLGGHALLGAASGGHGCYECLFVDERGDETLYARSDLADPGQTFHTSHAACGGAYTPYADLDARRTAELAARMVVGALHDGALSAHLRTWKSDGSSFLDAGFRPSSRFELMGSELRADALALASPRCPVCGGSR